jgi:hypothetical protein
MGERGLVENGRICEPAFGGVGGVCFLCGSGPDSVCRGLACEWLSGGVLLSHTLPGAVPSALWVLASGFGMGPGVSPTL